MAEFRLTPPRDPGAMGALYGAPDQMPSWLQAGMTAAPPGPEFPPGPPSRMDAAYAQSLDRLAAMRDAARNDPASIAQNFGGPGLAAAAVLRAMENSDRSGQRGMMPLGGFRRQNVALPANAQPTAGEAPAPQADLLPVLLQQKTDLQKEIAGATKARDLQAKSGAGPKWQAAVDTANGLITKMDALDRQIGEEQKSRAELMKRSSPEYQRMLTEGDKAATARDESLANRRQSYEEFMPQGVQNMQAWLPMATAAGIHGVKEIFNVAKNNSAAGRWTNAIEAASASKKGADRMRNADLSAAYAKEFPAVGKMKPYAIAAGAGAVEGAALSNTPEIYNSFLPAINQERAAWEQYLKALPADHPDRVRAEKLIAGMPEKNPIKEAALEHLLSRASLTRGAEGALEGAIGATTAKSLIGGFNPTFPRAEAATLVKEMKRAAKDAPKGGGRSKKSVAEALIDPPETVLQLPSGPMPPRLALPAPPPVPGPPWPRGYSPLE